MTIQQFGLVWFLCALIALLYALLVYKTETPLDELRAQKWIEIITGISIPYSCKIGHSFYIGHFGNIIINDIERGLFVVRKKGTLSVSDFELRTKFSMAPNPTKNNPTIRAKENLNVTAIEVFSILGRKVFSKENIYKKEFILPIHNLSKGMYLVKINHKITKKLVIQ
mgnify:CR=1 FL=1